MVQHGKPLLLRSENLSLLSKTHVKGVGEKQLYKVVPNSTHMLCPMCAHTAYHTHINKASNLKCEDRSVWGLGRMMVHAIIYARVGNSNF